MSTSRSRKGTRLAAATGLLLAEIARGRLARFGWVVLALVAFLVGSWMDDPGKGFRYAVFLFVGNWTVLCAGDVLDREYRAGRASALLLAGLSRAEHWLAVCGAWTIAWLGGAFLFFGAATAWGRVRGVPVNLLGTMILPLVGMAWLAALGWFLGIFFRRWSNVAALLVLAAGIRLAATAPQLPGPLSTVARLLGGDPGGTCAAGPPDLSWLVTAALARWALLLAAGAVLVETRWARRGLERAMRAQRA